LASNDEPIRLLDQLLRQSRKEELPEYVREMLRTLLHLLDKNASSGEVANICDGIIHWYLDAGFKEVPLHQRLYDIVKGLRRKC